MLDDKEGRIRAIGVWHGTRAADATQRSVPRRRWGDQEIGRQAAKLEGDKRQKAQALEGFRFWPFSSLRALDTDVRLPAYEVAFPSQQGE